MARRSTNLAHTVDLLETRVHRHDEVDRQLAENAHTVVVEVLGRRRVDHALRSRG